MFTVDDKAHIETWLNGTIVPILDVVPAVPTITKNCGWKCIARTHIYRADNKKWHQSLRAFGPKWKARGRGSTPNRFGEPRSGTSTVIVRLDLAVAVQFLG